MRSIVTFDRHPALAVAKLNNSINLTEKREDNMVFVFVFSSLFSRVINMNDTMIIDSIKLQYGAIQYATLDHKSLSLKCHFFIEISTSSESE